MIISIRSQASSEERAHLLALLGRVTGHQRPITPTLIDGREVIALDGNQLIGMMAVRDKRPFSLDEKLGNIDRFLPPGRRICEVRLLAVLPSHRNGMVFQGLLKLLLDHGLSQHYNLAVISGTVRQQKLYKHLGFVPFGPLAHENQGSPAEFKPSNAMPRSVRKGEPFKCNPPSATLPATMIVEFSPA